MKKFLAPLFVGGLLAVALSGTAGAGSVVTGCSYTVTGTVAPGNTITMQGSGFQNGGELPVSVNGVVVAVVQIQQGGILPPTNIEIPGDASLPIELSIPCGAGPGSGIASQTFGEALAFTGSGDSTTTWIAVGLAAIVVGGVFVVGSRRRSQLQARSQLNA